MRKDKLSTQQQRGIAVPKPDIVKPDKPFIPYKYKNSMKLSTQEGKLLYQVTPVTWSSGYTGLY